METKVSERQVIGWRSRKRVADVRLARRRDIHRARNLAITAGRAGEANRPHHAGAAELTWASCCAIQRQGNGQAQRPVPRHHCAARARRTVKVLVESLQKLVDMERTAFGMDAEPQDDDKKGVGEGGQCQSAATGPGTQRWSAMSALVRLWPEKQATILCMVSELPSFNGWNDAVPTQNWREFHAAGAQFNERLFMAGNQFGETKAVAQSGPCT